MTVAGHLLTRNGDAMNTSISPATDAADLLALAWLDDDGAPPAVSPPQSADGQTSHGYRLARAIAGSAVLLPAYHLVIGRTGRHAAHR
jgi:hypothetical protein